MHGLQGRRALITGGGTGIGYGIAQRLLAEGVAVTIAGRRENVLVAAAERLRAAGGVVSTVRCDATNEVDVARAVEVAADGGNLDILVCNAGTGMVGRIVDMPIDAWMTPFQVNVAGTASCIRQAAAVMVEHGGGSVIAISSTAAAKVQPWMSSYNVSKSALDTLVRCAAVELAAERVRVNAIQPGYVPTETLQTYGGDEVGSVYHRATPLGRVGDPADVANAVAFLAGDESSWITGQVFGVDGGLNIPVMPSMAPIAARVYGDEFVAGRPLVDYTMLNGAIPP